MEDSYRPLKATPTNPPGPTPPKTDAARELLVGPRPVSNEADEMGDPLSQSVAAPYNGCADT